MIENVTAQRDCFRKRVAKLEKEKERLLDSLGKIFSSVLSSLAQVGLIQSVPSLFNEDRFTLDNLHNVDRVFESLRILFLQGHPSASPEEERLLWLLGRYGCKARKPLGYKFGSVYFLGGYVCEHKPNVPHELP